MTLVPIQQGTPRLSKQLTSYKVNHYSISVDVFDDFGLCYDIKRYYCGRYTVGYMESDGSDKLKFYMESNGAAVAACDTKIIFFNVNGVAVSTVDIHPVLVKWYHYDASADIHMIYGDFSQNKKKMAHFPTLITRLHTGRIQKFFHRCKHH